MSGAVARTARRLFAGGWAARLTYPLGLQGRLSVASHMFAVPRRRRHDQPLRIAFASDFHAGATTHPELLARACAALNDIHADLVLLGGDFVAFDAADIEPLLPLLSRVTAPLGKLAVLGNHDLSGGEADIRSVLDRAGVRVLANENVRLPAPHDDVWVCGLDDPLFGTPRPAAAFAGASGIRLVLMHSPDGLLWLGDRRFDVAFCGHTHGGQIALPTGRAVVLPRGRLSRRFAKGTFALRRESRLLVSRGIGCTTLPLRLFAAPQVHSCVVLGEAAGHAGTGGERVRRRRPTPAPPRNTPE